MFRPKKMTRVIIIGPKQSLESTIRELHTLKFLHIIDFAEPDQNFKRGQPLESASETSDSLVALRSMSSILRLEGESKKAGIKERGNEDENLREKILTLEQIMNENRYTKEEVENALRDTRTKIEAYRSFAALDLPFEYYSGYKNLAIFTGSVKRGLTDIERVTKDYELLCHEDVIALFVPLEKKGEIENYLAEKDFSPLEPPDDRGDPAEKLRQLESHADRLENKLKEVNERLGKLREKHAQFIIQTEKSLAIEIEKVEAPLMFASTEHSFIVDGWVPKESYPVLKRHLDIIEGLYVGEVEKEKEEPPVLLNNPRPSQPFEMLVLLYSTPSYKEIDPTLVLSLIFPLFFGFMIGDAGFGLVMIVLGYYMSRTLWKTLDVPSFRELGHILVLGGVFSLLFGLFLFGEFFAIPFHSTGETKLDVGDWSGYLGVNLPLAPVIHKIEDIKDLLVISIIAAGLHLGIGYIIGIRNELQHDWKHALAKFGWLMILAALFLEIMIVVKGTRIGGFMVNIFFPYAPSLTVNFGRIPISIPTLIMIIAGIAMFLPAEGAMAIPEVIGLAANILSYARLAGIAVAKAAISIGVTKILLLVLRSGNTPLIILGGLLVFILYIMVFLLGMIAAGIQALRLNYVEFFRKFYKGNGSLFRPFGTSKGD